MPISAKKNLNQSCLNCELRKVPIILQSFWTAVMQAVRCVLFESTEVLSAFKLFPQFGPMTRLKPQIVTHAEVLTSQISPPSCGCQIFLPSYCLPHARIFNMLQSLILRGRVWNTRFDGYDHERHFTPSGTLKMDRPIWITQTYCIATDGHCIIVVRYYSTKNGSNGIFGNFWELILFYVVSTSST